MNKALMSIFTRLWLFSANGFAQVQEMPAPTSSICRRDRSGWVHIGCRAPNLRRPQILVRVDRAICRRPIRDSQLVRLLIIRIPFHKRIIFSHEGIKTLIIEDFWFEYPDFERLFSIRSGHLAASMITATISERALSCRCQSKPPLGALHWIGCQAPSDWICPTIPSTQGRCSPSVGTSIVGTSNTGAV